MDNDNDYCKLNQVVTPAALTDVVSLPKHINTYPGICNTTIDLASMFFFIPFYMYHQMQIAFIWLEQQ